MTIDVVSNRADLVSGGDALVEIRGAARSELEVDVDGRAITSAFRDAGDGRLLGRVDGLVVGANTLTARLPGGRGARLTITNHPIGGPIFAGPQVQPWACVTESEGLGAAQDEQCNAPSRVEFFYKSALTGTFRAYDPDSPPPDGEVATTTDEGRTVPYVVRQEKGVQDRGIYAIAVLADPSKRWTPFAPQASWNRKVMWLFGGGSNPYYGQAPVPHVLDDNALSRGFMVATNALNTHHFDANDNVSAEATMMLKEHIIETYGEVRRTIGIGCSGGAVQAHMISSMHPGLLDGIIPSCSFPDLWTENNELGDCYLLEHYFNETSPVLWADASQRTAVMGKSSSDGCQIWASTYSSLNDPSAKNPFEACGAPRDQIYDPQTNPEGVRCTIADHQVAIWGRRAEDGFAKRAFDNVGVQYGLEALRTGVITPEQFIDMNEKVGGVDIDFNYQAARSEADPGTPEIAYRTSQVTDARLLADVPILDLRGHSTTEWHQDYSSYATRARLDLFNGGHGNQVIWTGAAPILGDPAFACAIIPSAVANRSRRSRRRTRRARARRTRWA